MESFQTNYKQVQSELTVYVVYAFLTKLQKSHCITIIATNVKLAPALI